MPIWAPTILQTDRESETCPGRQYHVIKETQTKDTKNKSQQPTASLKSHGLQHHCNQKMRDLNQPILYEYSTLKNKVQNRHCQPMDMYLRMLTNHECFICLFFYESKYLVK